MKRYILYKNKKLMLYFTIFSIISLFEGVWMLAFNKSQLSSIIYIILSFASLIFIVNGVKVYVVDQKKIIQGLFCKNTVNYSDIEKVELQNDKIILYSKNANNMVIQINSDSSKEIEEILSLIKNETNLAEFDNIINSIAIIMNNDKDSNQNKNKLRGWVLLLYIYIAAFLFNDIILLTSIIFKLKLDHNLLYVNTLRTLVIAFFVIIQIMLLIAFTKKKKKVIFYIRIYRWLYVFYRIFIEITNFYVNSDFVDCYNIGFAALRILGTLIITLFIIEYVTTSKRIRHTLIN